MKNFIVYCFRKEYKLLPCPSIQEGLDRLTDLSEVHEIEPIGVYIHEYHDIIWHTSYLVQLKTMKGRQLHYAHLLPLFTHL
ncbi:hypothetical protein [Larkinella soli]|uniref:hypothetical protein n=1 Tax=Larkinella soli TaxID=1770527 RepID=UPI000FFBB6D6|nr:hypothetical protein [Larkinella soli]